MLRLSKNNILQILPQLGAGGVPQGCLDISRAIVAAGGQAFVASGGGKRVSELTNLGAHHLYLPLESKNPVQMLYNARYLVNAIHQHQIQLIHARSRAPAWSGLWAAKMASIPFVTTFHGTYNFHNNVKKYYNSVMARGDRVIAISEYIQNHIALHYHKYCNKESIRLIHRGVDINAFDPQSIQQNQITELRQQWGVKPIQTLVLMPGRLTRWKGQQLLLNALLALPRQAFKCVFVGSDQGRKHYCHELEAFVQQHNLGQEVYFQDNFGNMPLAYAAADVVVHASTDPEAFGRVVAEAQAMGKPVIASDLGAPREIIVPQETGWLFSPFALHELVACLQDVQKLTAHDLTQLAAQARARIMNHFSFDLMAQKTLQVYEELLNLRPKQ